ncbi:2-phosphosulfolactate phosphatase [Sporosarcina sp. CAU 1771]
MQTTPKKNKHPKLHLVLSKEEIDSAKIDETKVAVVFDVLLATTTIAAVLHYGAKEVIPVLDGAEALQIKETVDMSSTIIAGELEGRTIAGFSDPLVTRLKDIVKGKSLVLSTTNGTVAIRKVSSAKKVYAACLPNVNAVVQKVVREHLDDPIIVVCAGSSGGFSLEDFYGAGYFIHQLVAENDTWELTDSAKAALFLYRGNEELALELLEASLVGEMLVRAGLTEDLIYATEKGILSVVPELEDGKMVLNE